MVVDVGIDHGDDDIAARASEGAAPTRDRDLIGREVHEALEAEGAIDASPIIIRDHLHLHLVARRSVADLHRVAAHMTKGLRHIGHARRNVKVEDLDRPEAVGGVGVEGRHHLPRVRGPHHHLHVIFEGRVPSRARAIHTHRILGRPYVRVVAPRTQCPLPMRRSS